MKDKSIALEIEEFMKKINPDWSDFKKSRFIFRKLGELYNYDPQYVYSNTIIQNEITLEAIRNSYKKLAEIEDEVVQDFVNNENKICLSLSNIYFWLLKRAKVENVELLSSDVIIQTEFGKVVAKLEQSLLSTKMNTEPEGFELLEKSKEEAREILRKEDIELGFIKKDYNNQKSEKVEEFQENESIHDKLDKMLKNSKEYFENVIGRKIKNVELHKYYNYLLGTAFKRKNAQIFPFHNWDFTELEYVIIGKEYDEDKYCYFLYNSNEGNFEERTQEQIREMLTGNLKIAKKYEQYVKDNPIYR